jgi:SP family myo-inositol transporter-like MFS transporter 13
LVIGSTFLSLMNAITPSGAFGFYAGWCLLAWIFFLFCYCETAGVSLEEVQEIFREGWGVRGRKRRTTSLAEAREKEKQTGSLERVEYAV